MRRAWRTAAAIAALGAAGAFAQRAEAPQVRAGDRWQFSVYYTSPSEATPRTWTIESVSADGISAKEDGEPLHLTRELNVIDSPRGRESNPRALSFPLEVGKRWEYASDWLFKAKGSKGRIDAAVRVVAYERVTVPAGEFEAFRLESRERLSGTSPVNSQYGGEITRTYWYSPAARMLVKHVSHNPYLGPTTVELVALELRP